VFQNVCGMTTRIGKYLNRVNNIGVIEITLMAACKTVLWVVSAIHSLHIAINFGQYFIR